jgi:hypothetical protein
MATIVKIQNFTAALGPGRATGTLFVTHPIEDSFARGTLNIVGLENVSFDVRVGGPPIQVSLFGMNFVFSFDALARELRGSIRDADSDDSASKGAWVKIIDLD